MRPGSWDRTRPGCWGWSDSSVQRSTRASKPTWNSPFLQSCGEARNRAERERRHSRLTRWLAVVAFLLGIRSLMLLVRADRSAKETRLARETSMAEGARSELAGTLAVGEAARAETEADWAKMVRAAALAVQAASSAPEDLMVRLRINSLRLMFDSWGLLRSLRYAAPVIRSTRGANRSLFLPFPLFPVP